MKKNYNYAYVNRNMRPKPHIDFTNMERADCTASVLKSSPVTNDRLWHTTDTNEFYFDWNGKRSKLNVTGDNAAMAAEIAKIKADMANLNPDEVGKKIKNLETKVNTAAKTAQTAANQVASKASKSYVDNAVSHAFDNLTDEQKAELKGPKGDTGPKGATGAKGDKGDKGNKGDKGDTGATGPQGPAGQNGTNGVDGKNGVDGQNGKSAFELAVESGYAGTEEEWLNSLKGAAGAAGKDGVDGQNGQDGITPHIGDNDNWFIGDTDTNVPAAARTGEFPEVDASDPDDPTTAEQDGFATVQDVMDYVNALIEKKKDELAPGDSADYIYINGIQIADKLDSPETEPIYQMNCFEITDELLEHGIMVAVGPEINGYDGGPDNPSTTYAQLFSIDVPDGYSIEVHGFDGIGKVWYTAVQPMSPNPRYATKNYGSKTYNCYVRAEEDFYGDVAKPADKYLIIINKN